MPEILYAATIRGKAQNELVNPAGFRKQAGVQMTRMKGESFREDNVPVPVVTAPMFKPQRLLYSETGWEPYRYPCHHPQQPRTVSINMEFTIPADSTEAHISYRD